MNINQAILETACIPSHQGAARAAMIANLVSGVYEICPDCSFFKKTAEVCEHCQDEWADAEAAREEEWADARNVLLAGRF